MRNNRLILIIGLLVLNCTYCINTWSIGKNDPDTVQSEKRDFASFLSNFKEIRTGQYPIRTGIDSIIGNANSKEDRYRRFLPYDLQCDCPEKDDVFWMSNSFVRRNGFIVAFLNRYCEDTHNTYLSFMEDVIVVYNKDGRIISSKAIARSGTAWHYTIKGDVSDMKFEVVQASLPYPKIVYEDADLAYYVKRYRYEVTDDGMIQRAKVGETWTKIEKADRTKAPKKDFGKFLELFPEMRSKTVTAETFCYRNKKDGRYERQAIEKKFVRTFLPDTAFTACRPTD